MTKGILKVFGLNVPFEIKKIDPQYAGYYDLDAKEIKIASDVLGKPRTLGHELIHAVFDRAGLRQTGISREMQEIICEQISIAYDENLELMYKFKKKFDKEKLK
jgi:hypothetical protein